MAFSIVIKPFRGRARSIRVPSRARAISAKTFSYTPRNVSSPCVYHTYTVSNPAESFSKFPVEYTLDQIFNQPNSERSRDNAWREGKFIRKVDTQREREGETWRWNWLFNILTRPFLRFEAVHSPAILRSRDCNRSATEFWRSQEMLFFCWVERV